MESVNDILGLPEYIDGIGEIYPVKIKDYNKFMKCAGILNFKKDHFENQLDGDLLEKVKLLDILLRLGFDDETYINNLIELFELVLKKDVALINQYDLDSYYFKIDEDHSITSDNFDQLRRLIMKQNILHEPKVFKNKLVKEWAEKVLKAREKQSANITFEDMISTISALTGKHYWDIGEYTVYQLKSEFGRIAKDKAYEASWYQIIASQGAAKINIEHFAENLNLMKNPYDDLFKSKDKLSNINKAMGDG